MYEDFFLNQPPLECVCVLYNVHIDERERALILFKETVYKDFFLNQSPLEGVHIETKGALLTLFKETVFKDFFLNQPPLECVCTYRQEGPC